MTSVDFFLYSLSKLYTILAVAAVVDVAVFLVTAYLLCLLTLIISWSRSFALTLKRTRPNTLEPESSHMPTW